MSEILMAFLPIFKEIVMQYGLWQSTFAIAFLIFVFAVSWRLPSILTVIKDWGKQ